MTSNPLVSFGFVVACLLAPAVAQDEKGKKDDNAFSLENIFPKKSMFGPRAGGAEWSHDGRYAAWLYTPYEERRHGRDLWLLDARSGKVKRLSSASVMAEFQKKARDVVEDRRKKAKGAGKDKGKSAKPNSGPPPIPKKDADDEKGPRYSGISSLVWAPNAHELLVTSEGDVYRVTIKDGAFERLTCTSSGESSVDYLPDGKGYLCMAAGGLRVVRFGSHLVQSITPKLPSGESMTGYDLSPDGHKVTFLTSKGSGVRSGGRRVKIARYRDRFMDVREVSRHVSDDPLPDTWNGVYLLDLRKAMQEEAEPVRIHMHKISGPRDILLTPTWAPDSTRVAFSVFEQKTESVLILEGMLPKDDAAATAKASGGDGKSDSKGDNKTDGAAKKGPRENPAKVVYRFLHHGGPNAPRAMRPHYLADSRHIAYSSEQTGFRHVHVLNPLYESQRPLTSGEFEVQIADIAKDHKSMTVVSTREDMACADVYRLDLETGEMKRLSTTRGAYSSPSVSPDGKWMVATFSAFGHLRELVKVDLQRKKQVAITDSHPEKAKKLTTVKPQFFAFENRHGHQIRGHMFKPKGMRKGERRPLLLYVYGGPLGSGRKQVTEGNFHSASYFFGQYMAREHGWITCTIDPRGMSGYGGMFEKASFEQVGKPQTEDLVDGVKFLIEKHGVDANQVAMHGWSFGGFQTQMCLYTEPDVFKVGIAGAGPTEWENYNSWYTQGTIGKTGVGTADLKKFSLLPLAKNLKGKLMLVHGMEDSNVLYQDTVRVYRELLKNGKETLVELFLDPTGGHGLGGDVKTLGRYRKYEEYLVRHFGSHGQKKKAKGKVGNPTRPSPN